MENEIMEQTPVENKTYRGKEVRLCADGKYRWVYEMHLLKNPTIFLTSLKVILIAVGVVWLFGLIIVTLSGDMDLPQFLFLGKLMLIIMGVFVGLTILSVLLLAAIFHGKYLVLFEMDENEVVHIQMPRQVKKAEVIGWITVLVGALAKNPTTMGTGMLAASKSRSTSEFDKVRHVKARRWRDLIKVNQLLNKNQVYVSDEDFDFVYDFIKNHCPNLK